MAEIGKRVQRYLKRYPDLTPERRKRVAQHFKAGYRAGVLDAKTKTKIKEEATLNSAQVQIMRFLDDRVIRAHDGKGILLKALGVAYRAWCDEQKFTKAEKNVSSKKLASVLRELKYTVKRSPAGTNVTCAKLTDESWQHRFAAACLREAEPESKATAQEVYECYLRWAAVKRIHILSESKDILMLVRTRNFSCTTSNSGAIFSCIKLVSPIEHPQAQMEAKRNATIRTGMRFIEKRLAIGTDKISARELYAIFVAWVGDGKPDMSYIVFGKLLKSRGFHSRHTVKGNVWDNVQILAETLTE